MILALHGNFGTPEDFGFLGGVPKLFAPCLWDFTCYTQREAGFRLKSLAGTPPRGLIGYSMGGRLALQALADDPVHWDFAIILAAHPGLATESEKAQRRSNDREWARTVRSETWETISERWNSQPVFAGSPPTRMAGFETRREAIARGFENWSLGCQEDLRRSLSRFARPVRWLVGSEDSKFRRIGDEMHGVFPNFDLKVLDGCGHRILQECPEAVRQTLDEVIESFEPPPRSPEDEKG